MKNTGKPYEALTQQVFDRLLSQGNLVAKVERDVVIQGKATKHQIDVTFEFAAGGVSYRTIIQCKDWASPVKQEQVLAFQSVLSDIPGQPRGIMVSRSGFQEGARSVAEHHGIKLYELREPRDEDWDGLIKTIEITMVLRSSRFDNTRFIPDESWVRAQMTAQGVDKVDLNLRIYPGVQTLVHLSGTVCDINAITNTYVPKEL